MRSYNFNTHYNYLSYINLYKIHKIKKRYKTKKQKKQQVIFKHQMYLVLFIKNESNSQTFSLFAFLFNYFYKQILRCVRKSKPVYHELHGYNNNIKSLPSVPN